MSQPAAPRSASLAAGLSMLVGAGFLMFAWMSGTGGHGSLSWQIAVMLAAFGLMQVAAGGLLWQRRGFARGLVVALALINLFAAGQSLVGQPTETSAWVMLALSAVIIGGAVLPTTTAWLSLDDSNT